MFCFTSIAAPCRSARSECFLERFNRTYREEVLDTYLFSSLEQVPDLMESCIPQYNEERPDDDLGHVPPLMFMPRQSQQESLLPLCA